MHKLNVAYNNAFIFMHHLPTYCSASLTFVVNRVPNCRAVIRNRIHGFMKRLVSSSNALVLSAVTSDARYRSKIVRHGLKLLYVQFLYMLMVVEIACAVIVDQFCHFCHNYASEWLYCPTVQCYTTCSLGLCNCLHMCLKIKYNNNNYKTF